MVKSIFKKGGKEGWGVGLDYLLKDYWGDLDKIREDNLNYKHDRRLINFLFPKISLALENSITEMKRLCAKDGKGLADWIKKALRLHSEQAKAKTLSDKVIFIDSVVQFLRATYWG